MLAAILTPSPPTLIPPAVVAESQPAPAAPLPRIVKSRSAEGHALRLNRKLNHREKRFCSLIVQGMAARRAYMAISQTKNEDSASTLAHRWCARPALQAYMAKLRAEMTEEGALSRAEKRHALAGVVRAEENAPRDKLTAIAIDNRMTGDDDPFRKAAGEDLRVSFFVIRLEEDRPREPVNVTPEAPALDIAPASSPAL